MSSISLRRQIVYASTALLSVTLFAGASGLWAAFGLSQRIAENQDSAKALRNHLFADMSHDAIRADVVSAVFFAQNHDGTHLAEVPAALKDHSDNFLTSIRSNRKLVPSEAARKVIDELTPRVEEYIRLADQVIAKAKSDPEGARASLDAFTTVFEELETKMETTADVIDGLGASGTKAAREQAVVCQILMIVSALMAVIAVWLVVKAANQRVVNPLVDLTGAIQRITNGDTREAPPHLERGDEIGAIANAVAELQRNLDQAKADAMLSEHARQSESGKVAEAFSRVLASSLDKFRSTSEALGSEANALVHSASQTMGLADGAASATNEASRNVELISAATTELVASIQEISDRMRHSAEVAETAAANGDETGRVVQELSEAVQRISQIVTMINGVAEQTNLLALNATIEAARAGDSGKGFAVVAGEVKALANQTSRATEEIGAEIGRVRQVTARAVAQVRDVIGMIEQMREISAAVAAAATQQSSATNEIASNVEKASLGAGNVARDVGSLSQSMQSTNSASTRVLAQSQQVEAEAESLRRAAEAFFATFEAA